MPRGLCVAAVDHMGVLVAFDAKHYMGLRPLAPFANVPSEHHSFAPHDCYTRLCPFLPLGEPGPSGSADINKECYLVNLTSSHILVSKIKLCMCKYELIQIMKL